MTDQSDIVGIMRPLGDLVSVLWITVEQRTLRPPGGIPQKMSTTLVHNKPPDRRALAAAHTAYRLDQHPDGATTMHVIKMRTGPTP